MRNAVFQRFWAVTGATNRSTGYVPYQPRKDGNGSATRYTYALTCAW